MKIVALDSIEISGVLVEFNVECETRQVEDAVGFLARHLKVMNIMERILCIICQSMI